MPAVWRPVCGTVLFQTADPLSADAATGQLEIRRVRMSSGTEREGGRTAHDSLLSSEALRRIDEAFRERDRPDSDAHRFFEESQQRWNEILRPQIESIRASEELTQDDFSIRINVRD